MHVTKISQKNNVIILTFIRRKYKYIVQLYLFNTIMIFMLILKDDDDMPFDIRGGSDGVQRLPREQKTRPPSPDHMLASVLKVPGRVLEFKLVHIYSYTYT